MMWLRALLHAQRRSGPVAPSRSVDHHRPGRAERHQRKVLPRRERNPAGDVPAREGPLEPRPALPARRTAEYFLTERRPTALEDCFTVAWWEQRGAGLSYSSSLPRTSPTIEQFIDDTVSVTHYLRERFAQDRIYLMAHSGGSFIGIQAVSERPELYAAYIGMAEVDQLRSERLAYEFWMAEFQKRHDRRMVNRLAAAPVSEAHGTPRRYLAVRDKAMHRLGVGTTHDMRSVITGVFLPSLASPQYSLAERSGSGGASSPAA